MSFRTNIRTGNITAYKDRLELPVELLVYNKHALYITLNTIAKLRSATALSVSPNWRDRLRVLGTLNSQRKRGRPRLQVVHADAIV